MTMTQQELESYLLGAANLLRGLIDPGDYKGIIFPLMFFKRLSDVYDEEYEEALETYGDNESAKFAENHMFQIPDGSHWRDVRNITTNVGQAIRSAMINIEKANPNKLSGIFGDTNWTNKERLSDRILLDLIEHFSSIKLTLKKAPQDEFGNAYEYLIKKFADDSGHNAAEFYTNRTVVRLMTLLVDPQPGESIYDPTCGSGGMLLNARSLVQEKGKEYRTLKLYGQEINIITSSIARINMFIHGVQDFEIIQGDTLQRPAFLENGRVKQFDICIANPPYSMKKWNRNSWKNDPWRRNIYGTPPQGIADYAFFQHILCSLKKESGRCAILFPHGILVRDSEMEMRKAIIENDLIDCVIGLGEHLFYNAAMEACIVMCRTKKPKERKKRIFLIDARNEIRKERTQSYLDPEHISKIHDAYAGFKDIEGFSKVIPLEEVRKKEYSLNIKEYILDRRYIDEDLEKYSLDHFVEQWQKSTYELKESFQSFLRATHSEVLE